MGVQRRSLYGSRIDERGQIIQLWNILRIGSLQGLQRNHDPDLLRKKEKTVYM